MSKPEGWFTNGRLVHYARAGVGLCGQRITIPAITAIARDSALLRERLGNTKCSVCVEVLASEFTDA